MSDLSEVSDHDLLARHVSELEQGDGGDTAHEAFAELFRRHRDRLWAVALRTTGNREDAADALQDAMIAAFRRAGSFRGEAMVSTWLHRIVVNACLDRIRRRKVRLAEPLPEDLDDRPDTLADAGLLDDPALAAERSDVRRALLAALEQLAPDQRAALVLVDVQGYSVEEAAAVLECAPGTIKSRCSRGRHRLAELLAHLREPVGTGVRPRPDDEATGGEGA